MRTHLSTTYTVLLKVFLKFKNVKLPEKKLFFNKTNALLLVVPSTQQNDCPFVLVKQVPVGHVGAPVLHGIG